MLYVISYHTTKKNLCCNILLYYLKNEVRGYADVHSYGFRAYTTHVHISLALRRFMQLLLFCFVVLTNNLLYFLRKGYTLPFR